MSAGRIDELLRMLQELGPYADEKCRVEIWSDPNSHERVCVTLHTNPPQVVCLLKWGSPRWSIDTYRPGQWEQWLGAVLLELRLDREQPRLFSQGRQQQADTSKFTPIDDGDVLD